MIGIPIAIALFLGIVMLLALPHELGHFFAAKRYRVRVEEFGLGFPPRLLAIKRGETVYSLNAVPLGGFTKVAGELDPSVPNGLASKTAGVRFVILVIGSLINALLAFLLLVIPLTHLPQFAVPFRKIIWTLVQKSEWKQPLVFEKGM